MIQIRIQVLKLVSPKYHHRNDELVIPRRRRGANSAESFFSVHSSVHCQWLVSQGGEGCTPSQGCSYKGEKVIWLSVS